MQDAYILLGADIQSLRDLASILFPAEKIAWNGEKMDGDETLAVWLGVGDARNMLESVPEELRSGGWRLARIIGLADATQLESRKELKAWWEMLAHFCDVILLANTTQVARVTPQWLANLRKSLKDRPLEILAWPEVVKKNGEAAKEEIIYPEARRLTQYYEPEVDIDIPIMAGDDEEEAEEVDEDEDPVPEELYFARDAAGRRTIKIVAP